MPIPRREDLPEDASDWSSVDVEFERLNPDTAKSCPESVGSLMAYIRCESADTDRAEESRLKFVRTAIVGEVTYWLWQYTEEDGEVCFVTFVISGGTCLGLSETNGLTPEQFLLADYYDEIYW